ncbi:MAG: SDR family oxidoreductase [Deltaproteobacteria bacterium]|nr:SDR family oxidoreductase [Deltaproteobacteria bacterium]
MARVVVTGGAGFIGSHLCDALMAQGHEVICVDNLYTGSKRNFEAHRQNARFEFIRHDVTQPLMLEADEIYHLACPASPVHYQFNPVKTVKTNVIGTINMLGVAKRVRARLLLASTSEVYGDPLQHPQKEEYWGNVNPIGPRSCYDEGKRIAETLTVNYHLQHRLNTKIIRIFNTYGPRMLFNDGRVVSNFIVQALRGEDITLYGDGTQTRSFCYVSDMVSGIMAAMVKKDFYGPVNLGNPNELSIAELAELVLELTGSGSKLVFRKLPADDPTRRRPDCTLAEQELGWTPKVDLREGLKKTIADFEARLKGGEKCPK